MNTLKFKVTPVGEYSVSGELQFLREMNEVLGSHRIPRSVYCCASRVWTLDLPENMTEDDQDILWASIQEVDSDNFCVTLA
jgi:hypothetical protein